MESGWVWSYAPGFGGSKAPKPDMLPLRGLVRNDEFGPLRYATSWVGRPTIGQRTPFGLENAKADCYRNSTWQALVSVPAFCNWLQVYHSPTETGARRCPLQDCPGCQLYKVFEEVYPANPDPGQKHNNSQQRSILRPIDNFFSRTELGLGSTIIRCWDKIWTPQGDIYGERRGNEDASEYLTFMQDALTNRGTRQALGASRGIFGLDLEVTQYCANDGSHYDFRNGIPSFKEFEINTGFPGGQDVASGLHLEQLLEAKWLGAEEPFRCPKCDILEHGSTITRIRQAPEAIFIKLDRFNWRGEKVTDDVHFPDVLDLSQHLSRPETGDAAVYRLSCILLHRGQARSGHYHSLIRGPTERWTHLNDDVATTYETLDAALGHYMEEEDWGFTPYIFGYVKAEPDDGFPSPNSPDKPPSIPRAPRTPIGPTPGLRKIGWLKTAINDKIIRRNKQNKKLQDKHEERLAEEERLKKELRRSDNLRKFEEQCRREEVEKQRQDQERVENMFGLDARAAKMIQEERERRERERIMRKARKIMEEDAQERATRQSKGAPNGKPAEVEERSDEEFAGEKSERQAPKHSGGIIEDLGDLETETEDAVERHEPKKKYTEEQQLHLDYLNRSYLGEIEAQGGISREDRAELAFLREKKCKYDEKRQYEIDEGSRKHLEELLAEVGATRLGEWESARLVRLKEKKIEYEERVQRELEAEKRKHKGKGKAPATSPTSSGNTTPLPPYTSPPPPYPPPPSSEESSPASPDVYISYRPSPPASDESSPASIDAHISFRRPAPSPEIVSPRSPIRPNPRLNRHFPNRILAGPKRPRGTYTPQMNKVKRVTKSVRLMGRPQARF